MKIVEKSLTVTVKVESIAYGDVFRYSDGCYMRIADETYDETEEEKCPVVDLSTGDVYHFPFDKSVTPVDKAKLVIGQKYE